MVVDVDVDFLFVESSIFPSGALGATLVLDFFLYLGGGSIFGSSVTPVRRREDTDRNGDAGVKVQFDRLGAPQLSLPFGSRESRLTWGKKGLLRAKDEVTKGTLDLELRQFEDHALTS